jgi:hypothetical protein
MLALERFDEKVSMPNSLLTSLPEQNSRMEINEFREALKYHNRKVVLERRRGGTRLVSDVRLEPKSSLRELLYRWLQWAHRAGSKPAAEVEVAKHDAEVAGQKVSGSPSRDEVFMSTVNILHF